MNELLTDQNDTPKPSHAIGQPAAPQQQQQQQQQQQPKKLVKSHAAPPAPLCANGQIAPINDIGNGHHDDATDHLDHATTRTQPDDEPSPGADETATADTTTLPPPEQPATSGSLADEQPTAPNVEPIDCAGCSASAGASTHGAGLSERQQPTCCKPESGAELGAPIETSAGSRERRERLMRKKFAYAEGQALSSAPAPDVKIGQRVAYKEYYGNEFGTIRWIGRVPQISADWTVGVEFDNAIGEGDGSLHGRRYFIAKDCFAKFLPLANVALVDQHVGRPEPGTMISVMSAAVRPGQMISIQRVSTVHVQHCFLNAPHRRPGAEFLAVNTRLHCQCPNCGPCAHVVKPPRTQRLRTPKNATHMCQFSTYTCCGMESSEEALCTYTGNKISSLPPPMAAGGRPSNFGLPPVGNSWIEGAGYLSQLQAERRKLMPEEYRRGAAPDDVVGPVAPSASSQRRKSSAEGARQRSEANHSHADAHHAHHHQHRHHRHRKHHKRKRQTEDLAKAEVANDNFESNAHQWPEAAEAGRELALVSLSKQASEADETPADESEEPMKPARIVYRDSIENRYLFPTDGLEEATGASSANNEPIDSTLEADLEDLSQARYGYHQRPARSSSASSSRNLLLKSLRSLVSCLGASTGASEHEERLSGSSRHSELRIVCRRPHSGAATPVNKSQPPRARSASRAASVSSRLSTSSIGSVSTCSSSPAPSPAPSSGRRHRPAHAQTRTHFYQATKHQEQQVAYCPNCAHQTHFQMAGAIEQGQLRLGQQRQQPQPQLSQSVWRQISSSSDCGFSSASQTSANLVLSPAGPIHSLTGAELEGQPPAPSADGQEDERLGALCAHLAARLASNSQLPGELAGLLAELSAQPARGCCATATNGQPECYEQLLAELVKKAYLQTAPAGQPAASASAASVESVSRAPGAATTNAAPLNAAAKVDAHQSQTGAESAAGLPRAFELKLTLSINNEHDKRSPQHSTAALNRTEGSHECAGLESEGQAGADRTDGRQQPAGGVAPGKATQGAEGCVNFSFVAPPIATPTTSTS